MTQDSGQRQDPQAMTQDDGQRLDVKAKGGNWGGVVLVVVLFLIPGGILFAKGAIEIIERYAGRTVSEATLLETEEQLSISDQGSDTIYYVRGETITGERFEVDDERLYAIADGNTPLPVRVERSVFSERVLAVRTGTETVDGIAGATGLRLAIVALVIGVGFGIIPFALPLRGSERKAAIAAGEPDPGINWPAMIVTALAALTVVGATFAWEIFR